MIVNCGLGREAPEYPSSGFVSVRALIARSVALVAFQAAAGLGPRGSRRPAESAAPKCAPGRRLFAARTENRVLTV